MRELENLSHDALPASIDMAEVKIKGAAKFSQLGVPAYVSALDSLLDVGLEQHPALLVLDVNMGVGECFDAFLSQRPKYKIKLSMFYLGLCNSFEAQESMTLAANDHLITATMAGELIVPNAVVSLEGDASRRAAQPAAASHLQRSRSWCFEQ